MNNKNSFFIVGIKGTAMVNIALILKKMGKKVVGSDLDDQFITDTLLQKHGIKIFTNFDPNEIPTDTDCLIYSAGHNGKENAQVKEAQKRGIAVYSQAEFLGEFLKQFRTTIAVAGCHGKTTTSSFLSYAFIQLNQKPSYLVGAPSFNDYAGGDYQSDNLFVIEADEYGVSPPLDKTPKFLFLHPQWIICTNIDFDHPDVYRDLEHTKKEFVRFFDEKKLILCSDDPNLVSILSQLSDIPLTYGFDSKQNPTLLVQNPSTDEVGSSFELIYNNKHLGAFRILLPGQKNILNASAVILQLLQLGFQPEQIKKAVARFKGAKRRFELIYKNNEFILLDDYGHHPHEIEATIRAARQRFAGKRIVVVFQPHTYSRTMALKADFAKSLTLADQSFILPIFPSARENPKNFPITSSDIQNEAEKLGKMNVKSVGSNRSIHDKLARYMKINDVILMMGAGDVYKLKDDIISLIESYEYKSTT